jgi:hypothetical protein
VKRYGSGGSGHDGREQIFELHTKAIRRLKSRLLGAPVRAGVEG